MKELPKDLLEEIEAKAIEYCGNTYPAYDIWLNQYVKADFYAGATEYAQKYLEEKEKVDALELELKRAKQLLRGNSPLLRMNDFQVRADEIDEFLKNN